MSQYYKANRVRNLFDPKSKEPFRISRSKIDLFLNCQRCFYLDRRMGVARPPGFPFSLNSAVDALLKKEFDLHRAKNKIHPLMEKYGIDAVPFDHPKMDEWRDSLRRGVQYLHEKTNLLITGGVDDIWTRLHPDCRRDCAGQVHAKHAELIIVDYKATSKDEEITALDKDWQIGYKRQMEVYQWLFRKNGFTVSDMGYFVYCNGKTDRKAFDGKLEFDINLIPYKGDDSWVEDIIVTLHKCLKSDMIPKAIKECDYCAYQLAVQEALTR